MKRIPVVRSLRIADVIVAMRGEIRRLRKENDILKRASHRNEDAWKIIRETLEVGPDQSVLVEIERLKNLQRG